MIVNVTSSVTLAPFPLVAAYTASKTAIEGFTAWLEHELKAVGVRIKLVEPGYGPSTSFAANGQQRMQGLITKPYESFTHEVFAGFGQLSAMTAAAYAGARVVTSARAAPPKPLEGGTYVDADLSTAVGTSSFAQTILQDWGGVDILINVLGGSKTPGGGFSVAHGCTSAGARA